MSTLLTLDHLEIEFKTARGPLRALAGISLDVQRGEIFGIVGETGCGKTVTGLSVLRLLPKSASLRGKILFEGQDLLTLPPADMESIRGRKIAMIFQDPSASLNPVFTVGEQIQRVIRQHLRLEAGAARAHAAKQLAAVGLPDVERVLGSYPHHLSGGMQQRVMIAMALACAPSLLIADEPTTALDVTIQAQILRLLQDLQKQLQLSIVLITHNLGVVAHVCDRMAVLYAGRVAESGPTRELLVNPQHPYTRGLMAAIPHPGHCGQRMEAIPGTVPANPGAVPGCLFAPRCPHAVARCQTETPPLFTVAEAHRAACFLVEPGRGGAREV